MKRKSDAIRYPLAGRARGCGVVLPDRMNGVARVMNHMFVGANGGALISTWRVPPVRRAKLVGRREISLDVSREAFRAQLRRMFPHAEEK